MRQVKFNKNKFRKEKNKIYEVNCLLIKMNKDWVSENFGISPSLSSTSYFFLGQVSVSP